MSTSFIGEYLKELRERHGRQAARALEELTEAGVIEWKVEKGWMRASLTVCIEMSAEANGTKPTLRFTNDRARNKRREPRDTSFNLDRDVYKTLVLEVGRDIAFR
jgi:hypothetical protein